MREILFRGKRVDNGEWVYGGYYKDYCYGNTLGEKTYITVWNTFGLGFIENVQVVPETVGQYTGLKDKNGKRIFEGDIVNHDFFGKREIVWGNKKLSYLSDQSAFMLDGTSAFVSGSDSERLEVIGNIHDNPRD